MHKIKIYWQIAPARRWFLLALGLSGLFVLYTVIYATGWLNPSTYAVERWLLNRPIGRLDCVFFEWRHVGEVPVSLFLVLIVGIICWRMGYHWKIIPMLTLLLFLCIGIEYTGKILFILYLPSKLLDAMTVLSCPQISQQPLLVHFASMLGLWSKIPTPVATQINWVHAVAQLPNSAVYAHWSADDRIRGYPAGHAMRWCFVGLMAAWLCWTHKAFSMKRLLLTSFFVVVAFFGGFMQFYIGVHMLTDTIAGYLLGAAAACCAIGLLIVYRLDNCGKCAEKKKYTKIGQQKSA